MKLMNKLLKIILFVYVLFIIIEPVSAGVGIVYGVRDLEVSEGQQVCIPYGVYNPFAKDVNARIFTSGEIETLVDREETVFVEAGTTHDRAKEVMFCFKVPRDVYPRECMIGGLFCEKVCTTEMETKTFSGSVIVQEVTEAQKGLGSGVASTTSANLNLIVKCTPEKINYFALTGVIASIIIVIIVIGFIIYSRRPSYQDLKKRMYNRKLEKIKKLKQELNETSYNMSKHQK